MASRYSSVTSMSSMRHGVKGLRVALVREGFAQSGADTGSPPSDP